MIGLGCPRRNCVRIVAMNMANLWMMTSEEDHPIKQLKTLADE